MDILSLSNLRAISLSEAEDHHQIDAAGGIEPFVRKRVRKEVPEAKFYLSDFGPPTKNSVTTAIEGRRIEYGPHIPSLCRLLEEGHFD